jgi:hypothetical protein
MEMNYFDRLASTSQLRSPHQFSQNKTGVKKGEPGE